MIIHKLLEGGYRFKIAKDGRQNFWPRLIMRGVREGWLSINDDYVTLKSVDGDIKFKIVRSPGEHVVNGKREVSHSFECVKEA
jgi:hypothetical protein